MFFVKIKRRMANLPIGTRLTLGYSLTLAIILFAFGVLANLVLFQQVQGIVDRDLEGEARLLVDLPDISPEQMIVNDAAIERLPDIISPETMVQILDATGQTVAATGNLGARPFTVHADEIGQALSGQSFYQTVERRAQWLRVMILPLERDGQIVGILWLARSIHTLGEALDQLQVMLFLIGALLLSFAAFSGWRLVQTALTPVDHITQVALTISQSPSLEQRVIRTGPLDEVGRLTAAFNEMLDSLQKARHSVEETLSVQRRFISDASHELRTPLTSLRGNVGILRCTQPLEGDTAEILQDMDDELARLSRLVENLLALARADSHAPLEEVPLNLSELICQVCRQAKHKPPGINLNLDIEPELWINGNADQLSQLVLILLDNAFSYTPEPGSVTISLQRQSTHIYLWVEDTGIGISAEEVPFVLERFYRGQTARQRKNNGSGLGLAIAHSIVQRHSGSLHVASQPGQGSRFTAIFPDD